MLLLLGAGPSDGEKETSENGKEIDAENESRKSEWTIHNGKEDGDVERTTGGNDRKSDAEEEKIRTETSGNEIEIAKEARNGSSSNELSKEEETNGKTDENIQASQKADVVVGEVEQCARQIECNGIELGNASVCSNDSDFSDLDEHQACIAETTSANELEQCSNQLEVETDGTEFDNSGFEIDDEELESNDSLKDEHQACTEETTSTHELELEQEPKQYESSESTGMEFDNAGIEIEDEGLDSNDSMTDEHQVCTGETKSTESDAQSMQPEPQDDEQIMNDEHKTNSSELDTEAISAENKLDKHGHSDSVHKSEESHLETCVQISGDLSEENGANFDINANSTEHTEVTKQETIAIDINNIAHQSECMDRTERMKRKSAEITDKPKSIFRHCRPSPQKDHVMDQGWAWMVLVGGALNHILGDGVLTSLGVFLVIWQKQFPGSVSQLSWVLSLSLGIAYIAGPVVSALCKRFSIRQVVMTGTIITSISFAAASQATSLWHLYVTFASAGLGLSLTIQPSCVIITYYFEKLVARANGVSYAGAGVGMFVLSPLFQHLIDKFGWQGALLIIAGLVGNMGICAALYRPTPLEIKNRTLVRSSSQNSITRQQSEDGRTHCTQHCGCLKDFLSSILESFDFKLLKDVYFTLLIIANFLLGFAYAIVILYLPSRAVDAGHHHVHSAFLVSVIGISSFVSRILHGYIIDFNLMSATILTAIAYFVCGAACIVNPVTDDYLGLVFLSILVGLSSGIFNSTIPVIAKEYVGIQRVSGGVGLIHLMLGSGVTVGSNVAGILVDMNNSYDIPFFVSGTCFFICSALIFVHPLFRHVRLPLPQRLRQRRRTEIFFITSPSSPDLVGQINIAMETD